MSRACKLVALDLDGTVWDPEMYELWGGGSPFRKGSESGNVVLDRRGQKVKLLGITQKVLSFLKDSQYIVAWVSTCDEPEWANECLQLFTTIDGTPLEKVCHPQSSMIYKANKRDHFQRLQKIHQIYFEEMVFLDNQMNNINDVSRLGVKCLYTPDGITREAWCDARKIFPDLPDIS